MQHIHHRHTKLLLSFFFLLLLSILNIDRKPLNESKRDIMVILKPIKN